MATVAAASLATLLLLLRLTRESTKPKPLRYTIPSPRETLLPFISAEEAAALSYPPNLLPGARDVATPYGTMRVYEWGPEDGRKVIMIHGDTSPVPILAPIGDALVKRGCRVMMFDLWGRGYSDTPLGVHHDATLFGMQILFAATSSSLSWTGAASGGFSVIAFSLGGGITMSFAAHFPYLINSIVLLAPAGLLRSLPDGYGTSFFSYPDLIPFSYLRKLVGRILGVSFNPGPNSRDSRSGPDRSGSEGAQKAKVLEKLSMDMPAIVQWQFDNHKGFVLSFIDTIKHGPLMHQHQDWVKVCNIIRGTRALTSSTDHSTKLFNSKMLVIFGDADGVVLEKELSADLLEMIGGPEHVDFKVVPGSHGFPFPSSDEIVGHISDFWGLKLDTS